MLTIGSKAPDFSLPDQNGILHSLKEYEGKRLLLYFYPRDSAPSSAKQAVAYCSLQQDFLDKGIHIVGISMDNIATHRNFVRKQDLTITLLSDIDFTVSEAYEAYIIKSYNGKPAKCIKHTTYLIDENGIIAFANNNIRASKDAEYMLG